MKKKGVQIEYVTLHVGIGTFRPMKTETIQAHEMHAESVHLAGDVASRINAAKREGRRVIAVGTTTVRTLEGVAESYSGKGANGANGRKGAGDLLPPEGFQDDISLFITPGFDFQIIDAMLTNFHLPKSTLLVLVSAFAGRERVLSAYKEAISENYRFYSFGDAMFIK